MRASSSEQGAHSKRCSAGLASHVDSPPRSAYDQSSLYGVTVMENLHFALLGDPTLSRFDQLPQSEWSKSYAERQRVVVTVMLDAPLRQATQLAVEALRIAAPGDYSDAGVFYAFYRPSDIDGILPAWGRISTTVTLATADGSAEWNHQAGSTTIGQLIEADDAEALDGDARRPYVVLCPPHGNGIFGSWQDVVNAWTVFWSLLERLDVVAGMAGLAVLLRDETRRTAVRRMSTVLAAGARRWTQRRATAHDLGSFLDDRPRSTESLSRLLGIPVEDVEILTVGRGFVQDSSGLWIPASDDAAQILRDVAGSLDWIADADNEEEIIRLVRRSIDPSG